MKLLVVSHSCATAQNQKLYGEIQRRTGWDLTLITPARWKDEFGNLLDEPPDPTLHARVLKTPVWANGSIVFHVYRRRWQRFLDHERFDAIYVNHEPYALTTAQVCWANRRASRPARFGFYSCQNLAKRYPPPFRWLERMVYRQSAFAFPITEAVEQVLRAKGYRGESAICALPIDPAHYGPRPPRAPGETVFGYAGRLVPEKGLRTLAQALGRLKARPWKLTIIGTGSFEAELRRLAQELGIAERLEFLGYVPHAETPRYLSMLDALILPSETQPNWKEQFGRVLVEALAAGTPVIGSSSGEIPRLIEASNGGLVFPERDVTALAALLERFIENRLFAAPLALAGQQWAREHVSLAAVADRMIPLLQGK